MNALPSPFAQFDGWYADAERVDPQPMAASLATSTPDGRPSNRMVLVRRWSERGFEVFTDGSSRKGGELAANPWAALCWHWKDPLGRQVRVEGRVERLPEAEVDAYWRARPRASRLSASTSHQSQPIASREALLNALATTERASEGVEDVPRPSRWAGFLVIPEVIEFWEHDDARFHHRLEYRRTPEGWVTRVLQP